MQQPIFFKDITSLNLSVNELKIILLTYDRNMSSNEIRRELRIEQNDIVTSLHRLFNLGILKYTLTGSGQKYVVLNKLWSKKNIPNDYLYI